MKPEYRIDAILFFHPTKRVAPWDIRRWMKTRINCPVGGGVGYACGDGVDGQRGRIPVEDSVVGRDGSLSLWRHSWTGLHPHRITFSTGIERLVRRLVVIEEAMSLDRKDQGKGSTKRCCPSWVSAGAPCWRPRRTFKNLLSYLTPGRFFFPSSSLV